MSLAQAGTFLLIAIGLSFDTFAASVSLGVLRKEIRFPEAARGFIPSFGMVCRRLSQKSDFGF